MNEKSFENFLEEWWMEHLAEGQSKDGCIEATELWVENLEVDEMIKFANLYGKEMYLTGMNRAISTIQKAIEVKIV